MIVVVIMIVIVMGNKIIEFRMQGKTKLITKKMNRI